MGHIQALGKRIELVSMDKACGDISVALYETGEDEGAPAFLVHTYSDIDGASDRIAFIIDAMRMMGGMESVPGQADTIRFPCGQGHELGCRRIFLEACKLASDAELAAKPLTILDKKSARTVSVVGNGAGDYSLGADGPEDGRDRRVGAIAKGLVKLAETESVSDDTVRFACGQAHDAMVGLLLPRALNVRAAIREQEDQAGRGVLAAPSAQSE
jgi:hypothetical protein